MQKNLQQMYCSWQPRPAKVTEFCFWTQPHSLLHWLWQKTAAIHQESSQLLAQGFHWTG